MENYIDIPNVDFEEIDALEQPQSYKKAKQKINFDAKNYLDTSLPDGVTKREIKIRLLPNPGMPKNSPFIKVHTHSISNLPKEISKSGYKSYICLEKTDLDREAYPCKCPICETQRTALAESFKTNNKEEQKALRNLSFKSTPKETVIMRVIERGKEEEGVKFWKVNISKRGDDAYSLITNLAKSLYKEGKEHGAVENIYDVYKGRDLIITITGSDNENDRKTSVSVTQCLYQTPISRDESQMQKWIFDEKKWSDVFVVKNYDYLSLVSQGKIPWWDNRSQKWVAKTEDIATAEESDAAKNAKVIADVTKSTMAAMANENKNTEDEEDLPY